ncbi:MAG: hypothetical protein WCV79_01350 [Candidatus Paceibacterota bacterium]
MGIDRIPEFLSTWCRFICVRPLFFQGCLTTLSELDLFHPTGVFGIYVWDGLDDPVERQIHETANTLYHELIHIMLMVIGYPVHNEDKISKCAESLATRQPQILEIAENLYPGFLAPYRKFGRFYHRDLAPQFINKVPYNYIPTN